MHLSFNTIFSNSNILVLHHVKWMLLNTLTSEAFFWCSLKNATLPWYPSVNSGSSLFNHNSSSYTIIIRNRWLIPNPNKKVTKKSMKKRWVWSTHAQASGLPTSMPQRVKKQKYNSPASNPHSHPPFAPLQRALKPPYYYIPDIHMIYMWFMLYMYDI